MPADAPSMAVPRCPQCDAVLRAGAMRCWLCEAEVQAVAAHDTATPPAASRAVPAERVGTYSLASLMMFVTLASVVCGAFTIAPGLGILLIIVAVLAFIRTAILIRRQRALGHQPHAGERAILFAASLGVVILAGVAAAIAAYGACWVGLVVGASVGPQASGHYPGMRSGIIGGALLGSIVGLYVGYRVFVRLSTTKGDAALSRRSRSD